ncbi:MAG: enoyl-CoA hydratase/isomerase family protein [Chloroflexi bacterium]|nr:enoyl-CoA hydratase/isomerase family protein [Chloroflexota bacterium]
MPDTNHWNVETTDHITTLTLNRASAKNSLLPETLVELRTITAWLAADRATWAVVVQGAGDHFSTGVDVGIIGQMPGQPEAEYRTSLRTMQSALDEFEALEKPVIAKLRGFCIGGGLLLALCCDFRIASQKTYFSLPEVKIGLAVVMGTQRITRVIGPAATKELVLLGERFDADAARGYGLVHRVVPPAELDGAVAAFADKFKRLPPRTVGIAKRIIDHGASMSLRTSQDLEIDAQAELLNSADLREAIASYTGHREPRYSGD